MCFIGQDLAASGEKQYATGATNLLPANSKLSMFNVEVSLLWNRGQDESCLRHQILICLSMARFIQDLSESNSQRNRGRCVYRGLLASHNMNSVKNLCSKKSGKDTNLIGNKNEISDSLINEFLTSYENAMRQITKLADKISRLDRVTDKHVALIKKSRKRSRNLV